MEPMVNTARIALANLPPAVDPEDSVHMAQAAIAQARVAGATIICFPECFVPGYRTADSALPAPDSAWLKGAWLRVAQAAAEARIAVVLGTERLLNGGLLISALVIDADGAFAGFQDKVQLDPSEEPIYTAGTERRIFRAGPLRFGIVICHEGFRYPETVRWTVRNGAHLVIHPHFMGAGPANGMHEKAIVCRAAENTCYFASINYAMPGSSTTSSLVRPDGELVCRQPYGEPGILLADINLDLATGFLAQRYKPFTC